MSVFQPITVKTGPTYVGPSFLVLLTLLFVALKLTGYIAWSWLWVFAPIWVPFVLVALIIGFIMIYVLWPR